MKTTRALHELLVKRSSAGLGLFTKNLIKKGDRIIEYTGEKISTAEANKRGGKYLFELNSRWTLDGAHRKNTARYINHSCKPNSKAEISQGKIFFFAKRDILPGEELTFDYGKEYVDEHIKPFGCRCSHCQTKKSSLVSEVTA